MKGQIHTTSSNGSGNQDWAATVTEHLEGTLTLALSAVSVDGGGGEVLVDQEVRQGIGHALRLNEDESKTGAVGVENIQKNRALVHILDVLNLLGNVLRGGTNTSDRQEDVILQEITGEHLNVAREGGGKHERLAALNTGHILALDNAANLGLETHVQHTISLIEDEVLDVAQGDAATLNQIDETTWGGNEKIATTLDLAKLGADIGTTVDDTWSNPRSVGELAGLLENLGNQLTGRSQNQRCWVGLALASKVATCTRWGRGWAVDESLGQDWEQETTSLSGTSLGTSHQIATTHDNWDGVLLDWGWDLVVGQVDVAEEMVVQGRVGELEDWLGDIVSGSLDWDIIVLLEVDTSLLLGWVVGDTEELALHTRVGWARNVLAIPPLSVTTAASGDSGAATTTGSRVAVCIRVEATTAAGTGVLPSAATTCRGSSWAWGKRWGSSPVTAGSRSVSGKAVGSRRMLDMISLRVCSSENLRSWLSPCTGTHSATVGSSWCWAWPIHLGNASRGGAAHLSTHVGRDVRALLSKGESVHVELISHIVWS